jgi:3D (Asp-Asp-Asp) domain-containing protein/septal ring factor EnvC (AmiA/AmiB activator)
LLGSGVVRGDLTIRRARALIFAACLVGAVALPTAGSGSSSTLRQQAQQLAQENSVLASRSRAAVVTLYALDSRLARTRAQLDSLRSQAERVDHQRMQTKAALAIARRTFTAAERNLATRLRTVYEQGDADPLAIVLGAKTLDDALSGIETLNASAATDRAVVAQARKSRANYVRLSRTLAARAARLNSLRASVSSTLSGLVSARAERAAYIQQVATQRQLNVSQIGSLESQAHAIEARAREIAVEQATAPTSATPTAPVPVAGGGRTLTVTATAYTLDGRTATGAPVGYGIVAVDPSLIPLGTRMTIPGYGEGVAADTGGAIQGAHIDVWVPTAADAAAWGVRTVTITLH